MPPESKSAGETDFSARLSSRFASTTIPDELYVMTRVPVSHTPKWSPSVEMAVCAPAVSARPSNRREA